MIQSKFEYEMTERAVFALEKISKELKISNEKISNDSKFKDAVIFSEAELNDIFLALWDATDSYRYSINHEDLSEEMVMHLESNIKIADRIMNKIDEWRKENE